MSLPISLVLIARNEAHDLPDCLESVKGLVSEIILVDNGSEDDTVAIARSYGAKVFTRALDSYAGQKNYALGLADSEWVLHLDPDEKLSAELKEEIAALFSGGTPDRDAYDIPYLNYFLGKPMRHCGLDREHHIRFFRAAKASFGGGLLHEGIEITGSTGRLKGRIVHHSYPTMEEYFDKFNRYTTLAAQKMHQSGVKFSFFKVLSVPFEFAKRYYLRLGFLDGIPGLAWSASSAFYVLIKYVKLWQMEQGGDKKI